MYIYNDMNKPIVSVIIPTYNRERFVTKAIDSVLQQRFNNYEIIVIDDGSTDNTKENLKRYGDKIIYFYQENSGVSSALNAGINVAKGDWIAILGSDDEWMPNYLSQQIDSLIRNPTICMQTANCLFIDLNGDTRSYFEINGSMSEFNGQDYLFLQEPFQFVITHGPWSTQSTIMLREAIIKAGLFDTSLKISEDLDLMARVALQGPFGVIREQLVKIYRRDESIDHLSKQVKENPIQVRESGDTIFEKLKRMETLKHRDRKILDQMLSANRRAIGNLLVKNGDMKGARDRYKRAFFTNPSITSLGKYGLSFLPAKINLWIIDRKFNLTKKK